MTKKLALVFPALLLAGGLAIPGWAGPAAKTKLVSVSSTGQQGTDQSIGPSMSAGGRFVAFESDAPNLVPNDTNGVTDVFVSDLKKQTIRRVTVSSAGTQANDASYGLSISAGGRFVAFDSFASNLVPGDTNHG